MHGRAAELITALALERHPEGGYFREIHRSPVRIDALDGRGNRAAVTTIYFLLAAGGASCWHRVLSDEVWHLLEGDPLEIHEADPALMAVRTIRLAPPGEAIAPVHAVAAGCWQAAQTTGDYTLVGCTVAPGFEFSDFELMRDRPEVAATLRRAHPALAGLL